MPVSNSSNPVGCRNANANTAAVPGCNGCQSGKVTSARCNGTTSSTDQTIDATLRRPFRRTECLRLAAAIEGNKGEADAAQLVANIEPVEHFDGVTEPRDLTCERVHRMGPELHLDAAVIGGGTDAHAVSEQKSQETEPVGVNNGGCAYRRSPLLNP